MYDKKLLARRLAPVLAWLNRVEARPLWGATVAGDEPEHTLQAWQINGRVMILQTIGDDVEIFRPALDSNRIDATLDALAVYCGVETFTAQNLKPKE